MVERQNPLFGVTDKVARDLAFQVKAELQACARWLVDLQKGRERAPEHRKAEFGYRIKRAEVALAEARAAVRDFYK